MFVPKYQESVKWINIGLGDIFSPGEENYNEK